MLAEADGDPDAGVAYAEVAERWRVYGDPFEEAMAPLGHTRLADDDARGAWRRAPRVARGRGP